MPRLVTTTFCVLLFLACTDSGSTQVRFDSQRAFRFLQLQCDLGPRVPNSEAHRQALEFFVHHFDSLGFGVERQDFAIADPYSRDTLRLANVIARHNPNSKRRLLFAAHWDSRPRCDEDPDSTKRSEPLMGANDGASGAAVLMQLATHIIELGTTRGIDLVLFDGEDWGKSGNSEDYLLGSKYFARTADSKLYDYAVVLDLVGEKDQRFYREGYSVRYHPELVDRVWQRAAELGYDSVFIQKDYAPILDDHISLLTASIPTIDIIDFDYPWWHTTHDTPDKCSAESLGRVGQLLISLIEDPL
jgi:hypothetical protein